MSFTGQAGNSTDPYLSANPNTNGVPVYNIHMGTDPTKLGSGLTSIPVFTLDTNNPYALVKYAGRITLQPGIMSYLYIASHEYGHQLAFSTSNVCYEDANGNVLRDVYGNQTVGGITYSIFDSLLSTWKQQHHLNSANNDTTAATNDYPYSAYPASWDLDPNSDKPDNELVADVTALGLMLNNINLWMQDWSNEGIQNYSTGFPNDCMAPIPKTNPPQLGFCFQYTPNGGSPINAFSATDIQASVNSANGNTNSIVLQSIKQLGP